MMKRVFISLLLCFFLLMNVTGQINFNNITIKVPNASTTLNTVEIGDVNNDGLADLLTGSISYGYTYSYLCLVIYYQNTDGTLSDPVTLNYPKELGSITDIEISDVNNDKLNDIVLACSSSVVIFYQLAGGGFSELKSISGITGSHGIETGDLNDDGLTDILGFSDSYYKIFYQNTSGEFELTSLVGKRTNYTQLQIGDLNNDGLNDIANTCSAQIEIVYQQKGAGITKTDTLLISPNNTVAYWSALEGLTIADVNNDGRKDLITTYGGNSGRMKILYQTEDGKIDTTNAKTYSAYDIPTPIRVADLNCDGDNEIIIGNNAWQRISIYNKHNLPDYGPYTLYKSLYYFNPYSMAVGDINNDKLPDIVDVNQNAQINILYNISKPIEFDSYDRIVKNLVIQRDTTVLDTAIYTAIEDTAKQCKRNDFLKQQIHQVINNEYYSGDSLLIRHAMICKPYTDTITTPFAFSKHLIISSDTVKSIENRDYLNIRFGSTTFSSSSNYTSAYVTTNVCSKINIDVNWIKIEGSSQGNFVNGTPNNLFYSFSIEANPTIQSRQANITMSGKGVPDSIITVTQQGATPAINISGVSVVLNEEVNNTAFLLMHSNVNWETDIDADWLKLDKKEGLATNGNYDIITISAKSNRTDSVRNATITFTGDENVVKTVIVKQLNSNFNIAEYEWEKGLRLFPNPFTDKLIIDIDSLSGNQKFKIYDLRGITVYENYLTTYMNTIDLGDLPKGIYMLELNIAGKVINRKIIKQ